MKRLILMLLVVATVGVVTAGCGAEANRLSKTEYRNAMSAATRAHDGRIENLDTDSDTKATKTYRAFASSYTTMVNDMRTLEPSSDVARRAHLKLLQSLEAQESVLTESVAIVSEGGVDQVESDPKLKEQRQINNKQRDAAIATLRKLGWLDADFYIDD